ncbi:MAG TPA: ATP-binding protein [Acidimicrobiales bacterium]
MEATGHFARHADQAAAARAFVRRTLAGWGVGRVDDVVLITSELFSNAVLHGRGEVEVTLSLSGGRVRLQVADGGGVPVPSDVRRPTPDAVTGRGLAIVDALAQRWGNGSDLAGRTCVWIEVPAR